MDAPIIVKTTINASSNLVWQALTDQSLMVQWFFDNIPQFEAHQGFKTMFDVQSGERIFTHVWEINEVEIGRKIQINWSYRGHPGSSRVTFSLTSLNKGETIAQVSHVGMESFPQEIPEFRKESCRAGWHYFMSGLKSFCESY